LRDKKGGNLRGCGEGDGRGDYAVGEKKKLNCQKGTRDAGGLRTLRKETIKK